MSKKKKRKDDCCCCCNCRMNGCCDTCACCCNECCCNDCCCNNNNNYGGGFGGCDNGAWEAIIFWLIACGAGLLNTNSILIILLFLLYGWSNGDNGCGNGIW